MSLHIYYVVTCIDYETECPLRRDPSSPAAPPLLDRTRLLVAFMHHPKFLHPQFA